MITFPVNFDIPCLVGDLMTIGIPLVTVAVAILTYKIVDYALSMIGQD